MKLRVLMFWFLVVAIGLATTPAVTMAGLVDNGDGTVTDTSSRLMWMKNPNMSGPKTWPDAQTWIQTLNASGPNAGYTDWRLPSGTNRDGSVCDSTPGGANCTQTEFATLYFARQITIYNPFPFEQLQGRNYWTSTELPGNSTRAMAQDFEDGGQNPFAKTATLGVWPVRDAGAIPPEVTAMYGVVSQGVEAGKLIRIDMQNAEVSIVGPTGFDAACGLSFDRIRQRLYLNPCFGQHPLQRIDMVTGAATPMGSAVTGVRSIAYRPSDDSIYGTDLGPTLLRLDAASGGSQLTVIGTVDKQSVGGMAARPSDGRLFGLGLSAAHGQQLFSLRDRAGNGPRDVDIGAVQTEPIRALTFAPDDTLFATDGLRLMKLDPNTGAVLWSRPFAGAAIGLVGGLAVSGPPIVPRLDIWIKDCAADTGAVPSSPAPCASRLRSPDIIVDNNNDGVPEAAVVPGQTNIVRISVRNRSRIGAEGAIVHLYALSRTNVGDLPRLSLVGSRAVDVGVGPHAVVTISMPWRAPATAVRQGYCLAVVLNIPADRANASNHPFFDNNKAATCAGALQLPWLRP